MELTTTWCIGLKPSSKDEHYTSRKCSRSMMIVYRWRRRYNDTTTVSKSDMDHIIMMFFIRLKLILRCRLLSSKNINEDVGSNDRKRTTTSTRTTMASDAMKFDVAECEWTIQHRWHFERGCRQSYHENNEYETMLTKQSPIMSTRRHWMW